MRPNEKEPVETEIEALCTDEERRLLSDPDVPEDVKNEIRERLDTFEETDAEHEHAEDAHDRL